MFQTHDIKVQILLGHIILQIKIFKYSMFTITPAEIWIVVTILMNRASVFSAQLLDLSSRQTRVVKGGLPRNKSLQAFSFVSQKQPS